MFLRAQTLQPAERLINDIVAVNQKNLEARNQIFAVKPTLVVFATCVGFAVLVTIVILLALVSCRKRRSTTAPHSRTPTAEPRPPDLTQSRLVAANSPRVATLLGDDDDNCCCDDDCCDQLLLAANHNDARLYSGTDYHNSNDKGPDIILFDYCPGSTSGVMELTTDSCLDQMKPHLNHPSLPYTLHSPSGMSRHTASPAQRVTVLCNETRL